MTREQLKAAIEGALKPIKHRILHPEEFDYRGHRLYTPSKRAAHGGNPLQPRHRLSVRLELLLALKQYELALSKEIIADTEAISDAKIELDKSF